MYTWFYGFSEEPFNVNPDPQFLLLTETHQQTLDFMIKGIQEKREMILVVGEAGSGKTTVIYLMMIQLFRIGVPFWAFDHKQDSRHLQLGIPSGSPNRVSLVGQLNDYLNSLTSDATLAVIIDEAQDLSPKIMDELHLLSSPEILSSKKLQILLVGLPEIKSKLDLQDPKDLEQKI